MVEPWLRPKCQWVAWTWSKPSTSSPNHPSSAPAATWNLSCVKAAGLFGGTSLENNGMNWVKLAPCRLPRGLRSAGRSADESARPHKDLQHLGHQRWGCPLNVALWDFCSAAAREPWFSHVAKAIQNPNQPSKKVGRIASVETPQFKYNFKHKRDKETPSQMGCS